ncbi:MAG: YaaA family protein [Candidatus Limisoma sp.]
MQILIGCAKKMRVAPQDCGDVVAAVPHFIDNAAMIAEQMALYDTDELQEILGVGKKIAAENRLRYRAWRAESTLTPAVMAYDGMVFNKLSPQTLSSDDLRYASEHLFIASFLYGLLRPTDLINPYRLEGAVSLPVTSYASLFDYWKPLLTDWFIAKVKADDGVLVNLASNEFRKMFDWKRVEKSLTVVSPDFKVEEGGCLKNVTVYAKMCRGAMTRYIIKNRIDCPELLAEFSYEGFRHAGEFDFILSSGL